MLNKFIDEGKIRDTRDDEGHFIYDFQTNNKLLFKERNNSLIELRFGVQELLNVINNVPMIDCEVKGVTTRAEPNEVLTNDQLQITNRSVVQPSNEVQPPPVPFPKRLRKEKDEAQQKKFLENLKQPYINLPFIEALAQMPKYAKFLKGLLTNKIRLEEACKIIMNERCFVILLNKLPTKEKDPGSFTIPCDISHLHIDNALADHGASISLIPYMMYKKLGLENQRLTRGTLNGDNVKSKHLYSASANKIDEKKPELKNLPQHLEYAYLHEDKSFPIIISSELFENEKTLLLQVLERRKGAILLV
ncbi:DNA-directed DNA polymerase [Tanacetum coccineum]